MLRGNRADCFAFTRHHSLFEKVEKLLDIEQLKLALSRQCWNFRAVDFARHFDWMRAEEGRQLTHRGSISAPASRLLFRTDLQGSASFGDAPFYMKPYINLRGVPSCATPGMRPWRSKETCVGSCFGSASAFSASSGPATLGTIPSSSTTRRAWSPAVVVYAMRWRADTASTRGADFAFSRYTTAFHIQVGSAWMCPSPRSLARVSRHAAPLTIAPAGAKQWAAALKEPLVATERRLLVGKSGHFALASGRACE